MKKVISLLLLLALTLSICGCQNSTANTATNGDFDYNNDYQYYYSSPNNIGISVAKCDTGYYVVMSDYLYYIDKSTMEATILCNKANCTHDSNVGNEECNAYVNVNVGDSSDDDVIQYYNGKIYIILRNEDEYGNYDGTSLYSISEDGSTRKELVKFDTSIDKWIIHRGYFYYVLEEYEEDNNYNFNATLYRIPMDSLNDEPEALIESNKWFDSISQIYMLSAYENYIYLIMCPGIEVITEDDGSQSLFDSSDANKTIAVNADTLKSKEIKSEEGDVNFQTFYKGKLIYSVAADEDFDYYSCNLDGSEPEFINNYIGGSLFSDGVNLYFESNYVNEENHKKLGKKSDVYGEEIQILNDDLSEKSSFILPFSSELYMPFAQDIENLIYISPESDREIGYIDKSTLEDLDSESAEYKKIYSVDQGSKSNKVSQADDSVQIDSKTQKFSEIFTNTKNKLYNVSASFDDSVDDNITSGFTVKLYWSGDGGNYSGDFQIYEFDSSKSAKKFLKKNKYAFVNGKYVAYASIESIPVEIKKMLVSIIKNDPIDPIEADDFSGKMYTF